MDRVKLMVVLAAIIGAVGCVDDGGGDEIPQPPAIGDAERPSPGLSPAENQIACIARYTELIEDRVAEVCDLQCREFNTTFWDASAPVYDYCWDRCNRTWNEALDAVVCVEVVPDMVGQR